MPNAKKLPSGNWRAQAEYKDLSGRRVRKSFTRATKKAAEAAALSFLIDRRDVDDRTVGSAIDMLIEDKRPVLSPSTMRSYVTMQKALKERYPAFCRIHVEDLRPQDVQKVVNDLARSHSPKTVRNYVALLGASMPARQSLLGSVTLPARVRPDYHIPDENAAQAIFEAVSGTRLEIPVLLAAVCTMRAGEICALDLSDISGCMIHVRRSMVRGENSEWTLKAPKTYSSDRIIEAPSWLIAKIKDQGFVTDYNPTSLSIAFGKMLKREGLPHCRFHDLRHFSASYMHANGVPTAYIMKRGGWQTETVLNAVYRHALDDRDRLETDRINRQFTGLFGGN